MAHSDTLSSLRTRNLDAPSLLLVDALIGSQAMELAREAVRIDEETTGFELFGGMPQLALSEACSAVGDRDGAVAAIRSALDRILTVSPEVTDDPARLRAYFSGATPNAIIVARTRELGVSPP